MNHLPLWSDVTVARRPKELEGKWLIDGWKVIGIVVEGKYCVAYYLRSIVSFQELHLVQPYFVHHTEKEAIEFIEKYHGQKADKGFWDPCE